MIVKAVGLAIGGAVLVVVVMVALALTAVGTVTTAVVGAGGPAVSQPAPGPAAGPAVAYALAHIGAPYLWGGVGPDGFDCSGLTQAAYAAGGVPIPRTSEAQWEELPHVGVDAMEPGDLVFFDPGEFEPGRPGHVGIYIGADQMVDAPHTGATVRIDDLSGWPTPFGAARPG